MNRITPRIRILILTGIALLALILLASSLAGIQLSNGHPVPTNLTPPNIIDQTLPGPVSRWAVAILRGLLVAAWVFLPFIIIYFLLNKEARKRFLRDLMTFLPILIILLMAASFLKPSSKTQPVEEINPGISSTISPGDLATPYPVPEYTEPPSWITTATTVAIGGAIALIFAGFVMVLLRQSQNRRAPLKLVEEEAHAALESIRAGGDLREAILRCYYQMIQALQEYRGIHRGKDMTPHEFENLLQSQGLPRDAVHQLTLIFEQVRYGGQTPGRQDEHIAISSLSAIINACQKSRVA